MLVELVEAECRFCQSCSWRLVRHVLVNQEALCDKELLRA